MPIRYQIRTGQFREQLDNLKTRIRRYSQGSEIFKIGKTNNPENRWNTYLSTEPGVWDEMVVLYRTTAENSIDNMERRLIHFFLLDRPDPKCENMNIGGGANGLSPYFLYIVRKLPRRAGRRARR